MSSKWILMAFVASVLYAPVVSAEPKTIGEVDKVQEQVSAVQDGAARALEVNGPVLFRDLVQTGPGARFEGKLDDGTVLTLGEKGKLSVDEFVYNPDQAGNKLALKVTKGAFLFVGGKIEGPTGGHVSIKTPVGTLGVRGTTVWGGHIDGGFGVLVLKGEVVVHTPRGSIALKEGTGTMFYPGKKMPEKGHPWTDDRTKRAVATVSFAEQ